MQWVGLQPVKALFLTTILYGFVTPFLIIIILHIANNKKIMGIGAVIAATVILL
jgi:Mn2+/Fe2+ NRAMP family transporter